MRIRIALIGELPADKRLFGKIDLLIGQICGAMAKNNADAEVRLLMSPSFTGKGWLGWRELHEYECCEYLHAENEARAETVFGGKKRFVAAEMRSQTGDELCGDADIILAVWNEDTAEMQGATWELIRNAYIKKLPLVWVSSASGDVYALDEAYYGTYTPAYLERVLLPLPEKVLEPAAVPARKPGYWEKRRENYLKKYKAEKTVYPPEDDSLLKEEYALPESFADAVPLRDLIRTKFDAYNENAIRLNNRYNARLYQRSAFVLLTAVFLLIASYSNELFGKLFELIAFRYVPQTTGNTVILLTFVFSLIGFAVHAILNFYVYRLSRNKELLAQQKGFTDNRFCAELLRVLLHFEPFGVRLDYRDLCRGRPALYMELKHLTDAVEPDVRREDPAALRTALTYTREMLRDQLSYHEKNIARYESIVKKLSRLGSVIPYVGFIIVFVQQAFSFFLVVLKIIPDSGEAFAEPLRNVIKAFFGFIALLIPTLGTYFNTKLSLNNFQYNLDNHRHMLAELQARSAQIDRLLEEEKLPVELALSVAQGIAEAMLGEDTGKWSAQYMNSSIEPMSPTPKRKGRSK